MGGQADGGHAAGGRAVFRLHAARAGRRGGGDRAVELPPQPRLLEDRAGPGRGVHGGLEARARDPAHGPAAGGPRRRGRPAAGRAQRRARHGRSGRGGAGATSPGGQDRLHRLDRSGPVDHARGGGDREARDARARRQEPEHHLRRRGPRGRRARRPDRDLLWKGRGVRGRVAAPGRESRPRPGGGAARGAGQEAHPRRPLRQEHAARRARLAAPAAEGPLLHRGRKEGRGGARGGGQPGPGERQGVLRRGDRVRRSAARNDHRGRGDLRARAGGAVLRRRGGGDRAREPHPVRPRRRGVDQGCPEGAPRRARDQGRNRVGEQLQLLRRRGAVRRLQVLRVRAGPRESSAGELHGDQDGLGWAVRAVQGAMVDREAYICAALRTPVGKHGGALAQLRADDLAAIPIKAVVERTGIDPRAIDDVILGCTNQAGEDNRNVARMALLLAGLPVDVPGQTVNRLCGSGLQAAASAAQAIKAGEGERFIAGGVESMTRAPYVMLKSGEPWSRKVPETADTTVGWRFVNPRMKKEWTISLGETAEVVAERYKISRVEQDAFAVESQRRAEKALKECVFTDELVPVPLPDGSSFAKDEYPRAGTTMDAGAQLN